MSIQELSTLAGLISLGVTLLVGIVGAYYMTRSGIDKQRSDAQGSAISALQSEITVLKSRIDDAKRDNKRLEKVIDTITLALKTRGITITIHDEIINIEIDEQAKKTMTIRISDDTAKEA